MESQLYIEIISRSITKSTDDMICLREIKFVWDSTVSICNNEWVHLIVHFQWDGIIDVCVNVIYLYVNPIYMSLWISARYKNNLGRFPWTGFIENIQLFVLVGSQMPSIRNDVMSISIRTMHMRRNLVDRLYFCSIVLYHWDKL